MSHKPSVDPLKLSDATSRLIIRSADGVMAFTISNVGGSDATASRDEIDSFSGIRHSLLPDSCGPFLDFSDLRYRRTIFYARSLSFANPTDSVRLCDPKVYRS